MVTHRNVEITLRRKEKILWDAMGRKERNTMAHKVKRAQKRGKVEIYQNEKGQKFTVKKQK